MHPQLLGETHSGLLPWEVLTEALDNLGVIEIICVEPGVEYIINISWAHWNHAPGTSIEKHLHLEAGLMEMLPPGAEWGTV